MMSRQVVQLAADLVLGGDPTEKNDGYLQLHVLGRHRQISLGQREQWLLLAQLRQTSPPADWKVAHGNRRFLNERGRRIEGAMTQRRTS